MATFHTARSMNELQGKVCLITGGSRTLGAAIARQMAHYGVRLALNYHQSPAAAQRLCAEVMAAGGTAHALPADVCQPGQVTQLVTDTVARFGTLDIVVNNVGPYADTPFLDLSVADFDRIVAGNVRSTFLVAQAAGRWLKHHGGGQIINIAATDFTHRSHSVYGLAKSGVIYLTEALALELAPDVRVNAVAPDLIAENEEMAPEVAQRAIAATPVGRLVTRAEIAEMVCLIATSAFAMTTGQTLIMDGGRSLPRMASGLDTA